jgi:hypothetical protein
MLEGFGISNGGLIEQLLKETAVLQAAPYLRDQFLGDVNRNAAPFDAPVKDMAWVLLARLTGFAVLAHTGASPQAQRTQRGGPQASSLLTEPLLDISGSLGSTWHDVYVPHGIRTCQLKKRNKSAKNLNLVMNCEFRDRN